jgi:hypothetical protein
MPVSSPHVLILHSVTSGQDALANPLDMAFRGIET